MYTGKMHLEERLVEMGCSSAGVRGQHSDDAILESDMQEVDASPADPLTDSARRFLFRAIFLAKVAMGVLLCTVVIGAAVHWQATAAFIKALVSKVEQLGHFAPIAYVVLYIVLIVCFMPAEFMHLAAGLIFSRIYGDARGLVIAFICSLIGALLSGFCCFMISRYLLYDSVQSWMRGSNLFRAFDLAVEEGGITFVALIRLSPVLPYSVTSYLFGVTALKTSHLLLGTFSGTPLIFAFNCIGSALSDVKDIDFAHFSWTWPRISLIVLGLAMAAASMVYITMLTRHKLESAYSASVRRNNQVHLLGTPEARDSLYNL